MPQIIQSDIGFFGYCSVNASILSELMEFTNH